jgi:hypothetical protein
VTEIHDEATLDVRLAARWYNRRRGGLGAEFVLAIDGAITKIIESPERWPGRSTGDSVADSRGFGSPGQAGR